MSSDRKTRVALLALAVGLLMATAPGLGAAATSAPPANFKVAINGKTLTNAQLTAGAETYIPTKAGRTQVTVRWNNDLRGSGYYVVVKDAAKRTNRRCTTGTTCVAIWSKSLRPFRRDGLDGADRAERRATRSCPRSTCAWSARPESLPPAARE